MPLNFIKNCKSALHRLSLMHVWVRILKGVLFDYLWTLCLWSLQEWSSTLVANYLYQRKQRGSMLRLSFSMSSCIMLYFVKDVNLFKHADLHKSLYYPQQHDDYCNSINGLEIRSSWWKFDLLFIIVAWERHKNWQQDTYQLRIIVPDMSCSFDRHF